MWACKSSRWTATLLDVHASGKLVAGCETTNCALYKLLEVKWLPIRGRIDRCDPPYPIHPLFGSLTERSWDRIPRPASFFRYFQFQFHFLSISCSKFATRTEIWIYPLILTCISNFKNSCKNQSFIVNGTRLRLCSPEPDRTSCSTAVDELTVLSDL